MDPEALASRLRERLLPLDRLPDGPPSNLADLAEILPKPLQLRPAAVLCGLRLAPEGWQVLLTRRSAGLPSHGGQAGFPGGRLGSADASPGYTVKPELGEVDLVFEAPLTLFTDPAQRRLERRQWRGRTWEGHLFEHAGQRIWGATAAMLVQLAAHCGD